MMNLWTPGCAECAQFSELREPESPTAEQWEPADNTFRLGIGAGGVNWRIETLDEKKPAAVSGLNPYQEETWRRQESLYRVGCRDATTF